MSEYQIEIRNLPKRETIGVNGKGPYHISYAKSRMDMVNFIKESNVKIDQWLGFFSCKQGGDPNENTCVAAVTLSPENPLESVQVPSDSSVKPVTWEEGDYAVVIHRGNYCYLPAAYQYIFTEGLKKIDRQPAEYPSVEAYLNDMSCTPVDDLITEIHIKLLPQVTA